MSGWRPPISCMVNSAVSRREVAVFGQRSGQFPRLFVIILRARKKGRCLATPKSNRAQEAEQDRRHRIDGAARRD
jgi:hypothetical protein